MIRAGTLPWFAQHETRLLWRDWAWLLSGGRRRRGFTVVLGLLVFFGFMHMVAYSTLARAPIAFPPDKPLLVALGGTLLLYWSLMLSQAMEAVTRAFYARGDLELILSSSASEERLFAVRIGAMALSVAGMSLALAAPAINILAWLHGARWLAAYGVVLAMAMTAVAISLMLTITLFRAIGPKRTRLVAQIVAAVIGASFVIGVQIVAILTVGTMSRLVLFQSERMLSLAPAPGSSWWLPVDAMMGNWSALAVVFALGAVMFASAVRVCAPRFGELAVAAGNVSAGRRSANRRTLNFRPKSPGQALRGKEWVLLLRDPWLMSQSLMQLLYLVPPFFLLSRSFYSQGSSAALVVPVAIMAAGQLAGGLAWLAISGEDAPDLIASAPVSAYRVWRAKAQAVATGIGVVFGPLVVLLAVIAPLLAVVAAIGVIIASASATAIQFWFRAQVKRSLFRRRHVSSRIATFAEALCSITWASAGALATSDFRFAVIPAVMAVAFLTGAWLLSPKRA